MQLEEASLSPDTILAAPEVASAEKKRQCPTCGKKMKKATVGHEPVVTIDACTRGDGLWFDNEEVGRLLTQLPDKPSEESDSPGRVLSFLGEVFRVRD